jgi:hypothetical protein
MRPGKVRALGASKKLRKAERKKASQSRGYRCASR